MTTALALTYTERFAPDVSTTIAAADSTGGALTLATLAVLGVAGYLLSLKLHPFENCPRCYGRGRHQGSVYGYAFGNCPVCKGTGRRYRLGIRLFDRSKRGGHRR